MPNVDVEGDLLTVLSSPLIRLVLLAVLSILVRRLLLSRANATTASGAAVMAIGIFQLAALRQLAAPALLTQLLALELLIVWAGLAVAYGRAIVTGVSFLSRDDPAERFAVGTWVAATAVLGEVVVRTLPEWRLPGVMLAALALLLWLWFLAIATPAFWKTVTGRAAAKVTGAILLFTVSTQSLVLVSFAAFPGRAPPRLAAGFICLGGLWYVAGMAAVVRWYLQARRPWLIDGWENTNCIIHGAMSITGLAIVTSGALPLSWAVAAWIWVAAMFVVVEGIELARAAARVRALGWSRGLFTYQVSQWARNFTFGMFYAFTLQLQRHTETGFATSRLAMAVVGVGQYVVLALLVVELCLFLPANGGSPLRLSGGGVERGGTSKR